MKTTGQQILDALAQRGITLTLEANGVRVHGGTIPGHVVRVIRRHKDEIRAALQAQEQKESEEWTSERVLDCYNRLLK